MVQDSLPSADASDLSMPRFWSAAAKRASIARALAAHLHPTTQSECFSAGLLQDMGVPVLAKVKKGKYGSVYRQWQNDPNASLVGLEEEAFGYDHTRIGALMIEEWDLPDYLAQTISGHHGIGDDCNVEPAIRLVALIRDSDEFDGIDALIQMGRDEFGLGADDAEKILTKAIEDAEKLAQVLN